MEAGEKRQTRKEGQEPKREKGKDKLSFAECAPGLGMVPSTSHM